MNDQLDHHVGDDILREVAHRLKATLGEDVVVARFGGDEFVIVCEGIGAPYGILPTALRIGPSVGVAVGPVESESFATDRLLRAADQAMYRATFAGGQIVYATD